MPRMAAFTSPSAVVWGWLVEKQQPDRWDLIGAAVCLLGMAIIAFAPRP